MVIYIILFTTFVGFYAGCLGGGYYSPSEPTQNHHNYRENAVQREQNLRILDHACYGQRG